MTRRVLTPNERRSELIAAARAVFATHGYHHATIAHIIAQVGCSRGTFYNYFDSKRAIFSIVADHVVAELVAQIAPIDVTRSIPEQIRANIERVVTTAMNEAVMRMLLAEGAGIDTEADDALVVYNNLLLGPIEHALNTGRSLGVVGVKDPSLAARMLLGLLKEPLVQARLRGEEVDIEALIHGALTVLYGGVIISPSR